MPCSVLVYVDAGMDFTHDVMSFCQALRFAGVSLTPSRLDAHKYANPDARVTRDKNLRLRTQDTRKRQMHSDTESTHPELSLRPRTICKGAAVTTCSRSSP